MHVCVFFDRFALAEPELTDSARLRSQFVPGATFTCSTVVTGRRSHLPGFSVGSWDLNSDPQACGASTFSTEP